MQEEIYIKMNNHNQNLSKYACKNELAIYLKPNNKDIRTPFLEILIALFIL